MRRKSHWVYDGDQVSLHLESDESRHWVLGDEEWHFVGMDTLHLVTPEAYRDLQSGILFAGFQRWLYLRWRKWRIKRGY